MQSRPGRERALNVPASVCAVARAAVGSAPRLQQHPAAVNLWDRITRSYARRQLVGLTLRANIGIDIYNSSTRTCRHLLRRTGDGGRPQSVLERVREFQRAD